MLMRAATVVQVLRDLFYVLLQLLVVAAIILSFKFYCTFYCMFYFTCDRSFTPRILPPAFEEDGRLRLGQYLPCTTSVVVMSAMLHKII